MPKKGQKLRKYTLVDKMNIVKEYETGVASSYLESKYGISNNTIRQWKYNLNKKGTLEPQKKGRKKEENLTLEDYKERYEIVKKYQAFLKAQREKK